MKLVVKVIINPSATISFNLRFQIYPKEMANLKITARGAEDLPEVMKKLNYQIRDKFHFEVEFNWSNTPEAVKTDEVFKRAIMDKFQSTIKVSTGEIDTDIMATRLKMHVGIHGACPDFTDMRKPKTQAACRNYIKSSLALPHCSIEDLDDIMRKYLQIKDGPQ
jgi:hypothetical protein